MADESGGRVLAGRVLLRGLGSRYSRQYRRDIGGSYGSKGSPYGVADVCVLAGRVLLRGEVTTIKVNPST